MRPFWILALAVLPATHCLAQPPELTIPPQVNQQPELRAAPPPRPLPARLEFEPEVKDPVFSLLIALVRSDVNGTISGERLGRELELSGRKSRLPWQQVESITRSAVDPGRTSEVVIRFRTPVDLPVPYSVLGYNPGSFSADQDCVFREWHLGTVTLTLPPRASDKRDDRADAPPPDQVTLTDLHLFGIADGEIAMDIDGLVDRLLGGAIDDTDMVGLALFRHEGRWHGVATGYNKKRQGRSGLFDFAKDEIAFPTPDRLKIVGRTMRAWAERFGATWPEFPDHVAQRARAPSAPPE